MAAFKIKTSYSKYWNSKHEYKTVGTIPGNTFISKRGLILAEALPNSEYKNADGNRLTEDWQTLLTVAFIDFWKYVIPDKACTIEILQILQIYLCNISTIIQPVTYFS